MSYFKIGYAFLSMVLGVFMFVYGGADDSPGGQLLGLVIFLFGLVTLIKVIIVRKNI